MTEVTWCVTASVMKQTSTISKHNKNKQTPKSTVSQVSSSHVHCEEDLYVVWLNETVQVSQAALNTRARVAQMWQVSKRCQSSCHSHRRLLLLALSVPTEEWAVCPDWWAMSLCVCVSINSTCTQHSIKTPVQAQFQFTVIYMSTALFHFTFSSRTIN